MDYCTNCLEYYDSADDYDFFLHDYCLKKCNSGYEKEAPDDFSEEFKK